MVVVDMLDGDIDDLHFDLPSDLRASWPGEVTTVVQLHWTHAAVGQYVSEQTSDRDPIRLPTARGTAYQWKCEVTVMDRATRTILGRSHFMGSRPPERLRGRAGESASGDKPTDEILA